LREGQWLREAGLETSIFCGGGWYFDAGVAQAAARLGYVDCTGTTFRPAYLDESAPRLSADRPCLLELPDGERLLELPTTHSLGMLVRAVLRPRRLDQPLVHVYFHDTELLDRRRAAALRVGLSLLARRRHPTDLDRVAAAARGDDLPLKRAFAR
jgi:hypothetical protein